MELIGNLVETYGLNERSLVFCVADASEIWYMEVITRHWVAKRVPDDDVLWVSNCFVIDDDWDLASEGVVEFAKEKGFYDPAEGEFSFRQAFAEQEKLTDSFNISRMYQVEKVLPQKKSLLDVWELWKLASLAPLMNDENQATFIFRLRDDLPVGLGCMTWFGYCGAGINAMAPVYMAAQDVPDSYADSATDYDKNDAWWQCRLLKKNFNPFTWDFSDDYLKHKMALMNFQKKVFQKTERVEEKAKSLYEKGYDEKAAALLNTHTYNELRQILKFTNKVVKKHKFSW